MHTAFEETGEMKDDDDDDDAAAAAAAAAVATLQREDDPFQWERWCAWRQRSCLVLYLSVE